MPLAGLLLLSAALSVQPSQTVSSHQTFLVQPQNDAMAAHPSEITPPESASFDVNAVAPSDDVCYKIRTYIFRRDDDHAPEFVRSTTCGPRKPHTKNAAWPKARLVPAN